MENYRNKGTLWLMDHCHEVALELSDGNPVAATAILLLLERPNGARAFQNMKIDLSPEEWDKLYHMCEEDSDKLLSNVIAINEICGHTDGKKLIRKNLSFIKPAMFTEEIFLEDPLRFFKNGTDRWRFEKERFEEFVNNYSVAKRHQPRPK